jgi:hypothetical protein
MHSWALFLLQGKSDVPALNYQGMKVCGGMKVKLHIFWTSERDGREWSDSHFSHSALVETG